MKTFKSFLQQLNEFQRPLPNSITGILNKAGGGGGNKQAGGGGGNKQPPNNRRGGGGGGGGRGNEPKNYADVLHHAHQALYSISGVHPDEHVRHISDDGAVTIITNPKTSDEVSVNKFGGKLHVLHRGEDGEDNYLDWHPEEGQYKIKRPES